MSRSLIACSLLGALLLGCARAEEDSATLREIRELRQVVEQQSKQIEEIARQLAKLNESIGAPRAATPAPFSTDPPRAEPVPGTPRHIVVKGETLTSIAKHYNIAVSELQKVNKIANDRTLQIGQTLIIPSKPAAQPEKKENP